MKLCLCSLYSMSNTIYLICLVCSLLFSCQDHAGHQENLPSWQAVEDHGTKYNTFAVAKAVDISTDIKGQWSAANELGRVVWSYQIKEDHASSLNFAFSEFVLPPSAQLFICDASNEHCQEFNPIKNGNHHLEMWTPILRGGVANLRLSLLESEKEALRFRISTINRGIKKEVNLRILSQECLIDVVCTDQFPQIQNWEEEIQSVGLISIEGTRLCTGVLLNNVREDFTPYFLTARHCGINAENAASVVVHWNYENSECRFGNENNKEEGDGSLMTFNSGATFLADLQRSDFTLLQLNEAVVEEANPYFAGWYAGAEPPSDVTTIHHANTEEKRITFGSGETSITRHFGQEVDASLDHIKIDSWAVSSTSGGSSGAPLFDAQHRVVGQLHGGLAACGNEESDWFGRFHTSWEGDSIPERQLKIWLDPDNTGVQELGGAWGELEPLALQISILQTSDLICAGDETASIQINISNGVGPFEYSIDGGESFQSENIFDNLGGGFYSVIVQDLNENTSAIVPFIVDEPDELEIIFTQNYNQLILEVVGGNPPYLFTNNGAITFDSTFNNLPQGNNVFSVIDANGCSVETAINLNYDEFESQLEVAKNTTCHDSEDGVIVIQHTGTLGPYTYQLNNGPINTSNRFENLRPGNYTGRVIDSLGNVAITNLIELVAPAILEAELLQVEELIRVRVDGGVMPYSYSYNGAEFISSNEFSLLDGVELIVIKDANGCEIELFNVFTSVETEPTIHDIELSPNPSYGTIWLQGANQITDFQIINTSGIVVKSGNFLSGNPDLQSIELNYLPAGIYYFQANIHDDTFKVLKFIKL